MTALDAAEKILREAGTPLRALTIAERMLAQNLWQTNGLTPSATVDSRISVDIKEQGASSRFQRIAPGQFALREWRLPEYASGHKALATKDSSNGGSVSPKDAHTSITPATSDSIHKFSFTDAAERVLEQFSNDKPMHYTQITSKALQLGWIATQGQTPAQTMYAQVLTEIERVHKRGDVARFTREGRGLIGLSSWLDRGLTSQIEQHNNDVRKALHKRLYGVSPKSFEDLIGALLIKVGFEEVQVTGRTGDGGIDVRGTLVVGSVIRTRMAVQVKRWKNNIQAPTVQQVRGSLGAHEQGLIITTSDFSSGARKEAERADATPVALMSGPQLVNLLIEYIWVFSVVPMI